MKKIFLISILLIDSYSLFAQKIDPLSKIIIKSKNLKFENKTSNEADSIIRYEGLVSVVLADNTKINSDLLEVTIDKSLMSSNKEKKEETVLESKKDKSSKIKKIFFEGNLTIESANRNARAEKAELIFNEKKVYLKNNVEIIQKKEKPKDLPIVIKGEEVMLDLQSNDVVVMGSDKKPIETTIELEGYPGLLKKIKTKEDKARIKKEERQAKLEAKNKAKTNS